MTDEQFQKLMEKLEEIRHAQVPMYVGYPIQPQPTYDPTRCSFCGGYHSLGGVCPHLFPTLTDHARTS